DVYDPATNTFSLAGAAAYSRLYHSVALLLPDATVVSMGSNPGQRGTYHPATEIYTPPYLFDANDHLITTNRPRIPTLPSRPFPAVSARRDLLRRLRPPTGAPVGRAGASGRAHACLRHESAADRPVRPFAPAGLQRFLRHAPTRHAPERKHRSARLLHAVPAR